MKHLQFRNSASKVVGSQEGATTTNLRIGVYHKFIQLPSMVHMNITKISEYVRNINRSIWVAILKSDDI